MSISAATPPISNRKIQDYSGEATYTKLVRNLRIGDVILTTDTVELLRPIVVFQNQFTDFPVASKKFTHVAIYVGTEHVAHSMPDVSMDRLLAGGVEKIPLRDLFVEGVTFVVLRYPDLTAAHHEAMHDAVNTHIGKPYDYMGILRCLGFLAPSPVRGIASMFRRAAHHFGWSSAHVESPEVQTARAFVCSDFVHAVYDEMFQEKNPCNPSRGYGSPIRMPCEFYANPRFVDVNIDA